MIRTMFATALFASLVLFVGCGGNESRTNVTETQTDTTGSAVVSQTIETSTIVPTVDTTGSALTETTQTIATTSGVAADTPPASQAAPRPVTTPNGRVQPSATPPPTPPHRAEATPTPAPPAPTPTAAAAPPPATSSGSASEGAKLFASKCQSCHGANGNGETAIAKKNNIPSFSSSEVQGMSDAELTKVIREGKGKVSAAAHKSKNLSDAQIDDIIAWIRSLK